MDHQLLHHGGESTAAMSRRPVAAEAALRAVQKPPAKPWRAAASSSSSSPAPAPPRVYRVEPREFRDLVQRLTGAPRHPQAQPPMPVALRSAPGGGAGEEAQVFAAAPWCSFPMPGSSGLDVAHHGNGALI
ncbi:hypothetical protein BRADI_4g00780v3 [Brachypodium distachyon]|uniref:VQ domain-containing protein n=1 Tax=Brachypodium distachyon TaxID=15368 RepID=A0A0Q3EH51_BRADI|nr:hypothetical protein BRADI_4g00780v3 [Brachypodium distachyon]